MTQTETDWPHGHVHIYTGDGKGKTTAALGLALRAAGAGLGVYIGQFMKNGGTSEIEALQRFAEQIMIEPYGAPSFLHLRAEPDPEDVRRAEEGVRKAADALASERFRVVILDEILCAVHFKLLTTETVLELLRARPDAVELVLTGRGAGPDLIAVADLVTEMRLVKHYFEKGVGARPGIER